MKISINIKVIPKFLLYFGATVCVIAFITQTMHLIKQNITEPLELYTTQIGCAILIVYVTFKIMSEPLNEIVKKEDNIIWKGIE